MAGELGLRQRFVDGAHAFTADHEVLEDLVDAPEAGADLDAFRAGDGDSLVALVLRDGGGFFRDAGAGQVNMLGNIYRGSIV